jgi:bis(5'-nucleosyl)-tetraphosphatase (symmetrical)
VPQNEAATNFNLVIIEVPWPNREGDRRPLGSDRIPARTIFIGDIHGCGAEFLALLEALRFPQRGDRLVLVGDLFNRGPLPQLVLQIILDHQRDGPAHGYAMESVCGNHDLILWLCCQSLYEDSPVVGVSRVQQETLSCFDRAGMLEDLALFLKCLNEIDTIRDESTGWTVVHAGIDPQLGISGTPREIKLTIKSGRGDRPWYDAYDGHDGLIVCGHEHQESPLIRRVNGRPVVINIDTSCCYGGHLTAYLFEEDRFVSVPAARKYYQERP